MRTLIGLIGDVEFGWALQAISRFRYQAKSFDRVIAYCEKPFEYLCQDFCDFTIAYESKTKWRDRWLADAKQPRIPDNILAQYPGASKFVPTRRNCTSPNFTPFKYGQEESVALRADVLFHARWIIRGDWIDRKCGGHHNWPNDQWNSLGGCLSQKYSVASIGTSKQARHILGTNDYRDIDMHNLCTLMAHAKVVVGESSFALHLAAMCGCPSVVITHAEVEKSIGATNRMRHKKIWNPLDTPCKIVEHPKWNPDPKLVMNEVKKFLCE